MKTPHVLVASLYISRVLCRYDPAVPSNVFPYMTPLEKARHGHHCDVVHRLLQDPRVDRNEEYLSTRPIHFAAHHGRSDTVELLLRDPNVNRNAVTNEGKTALHIAAENQQVRGVGKRLYAHMDWCEVWYVGRGWASAAGHPSVGEERSRGACRTNFLSLFQLTNEFKSYSKI